MFLNEKRGGGGGEPSSFSVVILLVTVAMHLNYMSDFNYFKYVNMFVNISRSGEQQKKREKT